MSAGAGRGSTTAAVLIGGGALAWHLVGAVLVAAWARFPASFDELQHLSFIRWMERAPSLFPRYETMRTLSVHARSWTSVGNYLNHPSPYYIAMSVADRAMGGAIVGLRLFDTAISCAALGLMLWAGFRALGDWKQRALFAALLVAFPKLGVIAGLINNDNAALVATAVVFAGLLSWQKKGSFGAAVLLATGLALAGWTKLTVLVMGGSAVAVAETLRIAMGWRRPRLWAYAAVALGGLVGLAPSAVNLVRYGHPLYYDEAAYFVPLAHRATLDIGQYAHLFLWQMAVKWAAGEPSPTIAIVGLCLVLALSALAIAVGLRRSQARDGVGAAWRTALGFMLALAPTLALHFEFGWASVVKDGFLEMAQPRYYYGLWPGFALGLALLWTVVRPGVARTAVALTTVTLLIGASAAPLMIDRWLAGVAPPS